MGWVGALLFALSSFSLAIAAIGAPVHVGMVDTSLDYQHPLLAGRLDRRLLDSLRTGEESLWQRNERIRRQMGNPEWTHGMTVAGLLLDGMQDATLVNFAELMVGEQQLETITLGELRSHRWRAGPSVVDVSDVAACWRESGVRVVNLSLVVNETVTRKSILKRATLPARAFGSDLLDRLIAEKSEEDVAYYHALVAANPQIVFVFAAGNDGSDLASYDFHSSRIRAPNVVVVGATSREGHLADYSNYGEAFVDVVASGSAEVCGNYAEGTSCAAPLVAKRIAGIFQREPWQTAEQAVRRFLAAETRESETLRGLVRGARELIYPCAERVALRALP